MNPTQANYTSAATRTQCQVMDCNTCWELAEYGQLGK